MAKTQEESDLSKPEEMFAWIFAAGVPDPRGDKFPNQPLIPAPCFGSFSKMLYDFGCRFNAEDQKLWVKPGVGALRNLQAKGVTDVQPTVAAMAVDQFPEVAARVAQVTPETHQQALLDQEKELLDVIARLHAAQEQLKGGGDSR